MISRLVQLCPVVYGPGAISQVGEICKEMGITRAFIVTGPHVKASGVVKKAEEAMDAAGIAHDVYDGCERDAPDYTVEAAGNAAKATAMVSTTAVSLFLIFLITFMVLSSYFLI